MTSEVSETCAYVQTSPAPHPDQIAVPEYGWECRVRAAVLKGDGTHETIEGMVKGVAGTATLVEWGANSVWVPTENVVFL